MASRWGHRRNPYHGFTPATRALILRRDPVCRCRGCTSCTTGCRRPSTQADHRLSLAEGGTNAAANGQGLCDGCHHEKTKAETKRGQRRRYRPTEPHPGRI